MERVKPRLRAMVKEANAERTEVKPLEVSTIAERNPNVDAELAVPYMGTLSNPRPTQFSRKTTDSHKHVRAGKDIKPRNHCFAISPCVVTKPDGTTYEIASTRNNATAKRRTKATTVKQRIVTEVMKYGAEQHTKLSIDEIRAKNGL